MNPHNGKCPACGHRFELGELKTMAVGDGWQRHLLVRHDDGTETVVSFDEFWPVGMTVISERVTSRAE